MKEKIIIAVMFIILLGLIGKLALKEKEEKQQAAADKVSYNDLDELAVFVTLENQIARNRAGEAIPELEIVNKDIKAYIDLTPDILTQGTVSAGDIKREPDYVSMYPNLYTVPLEEYDEIPKEKKVCYLTFDDGPSEFTPKVLEILDEYGIKATFFVIGEELERLEENKEYLKEIVNRGHTIGLHTYCHDYGTIYKSINSFLADYEKVFNLIEEITGQRPYIYRFPGGSYNKYLTRMRKELIAEMNRRGFVYYDWNVSGEDAVGAPTSYSIQKNVSKDLSRYQLPVVLLHDGMENKITYKTLPSIIEYIKAKGYNFDTLNHRFPCQFRW